LLVLRKAKTVFRLKRHQKGAYMAPFLCPFLAKLNVATMFYLQPEDYRFVFVREIMKYQF
jgi:hypothetical protein